MVLLIYLGSDNVTSSGKESGWSINKKMFVDNCNTCAKNKFLGGFLSHSIDNFLRRNSWYE